MPSGKSGAPNYVPVTERLPRIGIDPASTRLPGTMARRRRRTAGFSLPELMVAVVVFGLIGLAIYRVLIHTNRSQRMGNTLAEAQQNARAGLDMILNDMRSAGYGIDDDDQVPIETASEYRVTFVIDRDADATIEPGERITYFLDPDADDPMAAQTPNPDDYVSGSWSTPPPTRWRCRRAARAT